MTVRYDALTVEWLGYATARLAVDGGPVVYTDPGRYGVLDDYWARDGDVVVVTHDHHYDPAAIRSVASPDATLVIYEDVDPARIDRDVEPIDGDTESADDVEPIDGDMGSVDGDMGSVDSDMDSVDGDTDSVDGDTDSADDEVAGRRDGAGGLAVDFDVIRVDDAAELEIETPAGTVTVWSVAAYNDPDGPNVNPDGTVPHPEGFGCGYLLSFGGYRAFWPGDSDALDGFVELDADVLLANIGGGGVVSDRHAAAALAERLDPGLVVPIHYDTVELLEADGEAFAADVASRSVPVALDERSVDR